jgi:hypothetical protein
MNMSIEGVFDDKRPGTAGLQSIRGFQGDPANKESTKKIPANDENHQKATFTNSSLPLNWIGIHGKTSVMGPYSR